MLKNYVANVEEAVNENYHLDERDIVFPTKYLIGLPLVNL